MEDRRDDTMMSQRRMLGFLPLTGPYYGVGSLKNVLHPEKLHGRFEARACSP